MAFRYPQRVVGGAVLDFGPGGGGEDVDFEDVCGGRVEVREEGLVGFMGVVVVVVVGREGHRRVGRRGGGGGDVGG